MNNPSVNPQLVEKLNTILEQAKSGGLTSFAAVTFRRNGAATSVSMTCCHHKIARGARL